MEVVAPAQTSRNTAVRDGSVREQQKLPVEGSEKPARRESVRQGVKRAAPPSADINMFPVISLQDALCNNKAVSTKRFIFISSRIGPRGMREYLYEIEDQGQQFKSYRPLGAWQQ